jgi:DNA helicase-2/ATP-dependent DNA helicase PcrA
VDEFQDNNYALNEIIALVAGDRKFITVVGDDDQVIYSFRGANSYNIQAFKDRYGHHPEFLPVSLEENFRSTQPILNIANESIKNNVDRMEKTLLSKVDTEPIMPVRFWGNKNEQVEFIVREILTLVENGKKYSDIAVLCRILMCSISNHLAPCYNISNRRYIKKTRPLCMDRYSRLI